MRKTILAISSFIFSTQLFAAEMPLGHAELVGLLTDVVLNGQNSGMPTNQIFQKSGVTFYSSGGSQSQGSWKIEGDQYCSAWQPNPSWACYDVTRDGDKVTFIDKSGKRSEMTLQR